jgi:hypothetical protein
VRLQILQFRLQFPKLDVNQNGVFYMDIHFYPFSRILKEGGGGRYNINRVRHWQWKKWVTIYDQHPTSDNWQQQPGTKNNHWQQHLTINNRHSKPTSVKTTKNKQLLLTDTPNNQNRHLTTNSQWPTGRKYRKTRFETLEAENYKPTLQHYNHLQTWTQQRQADFTILFYRLIIIIDSSRWTNSLSNK